MLGEALESETVLRVLNSFKSTSKHQSEDLENWIVGLKMLCNISEAPDRLETLKAPENEVLVEAL